jgi:uncharacterized protein YndB with AHSA1/START domain
METTVLNVTAIINAPIAKVWDCWNNPEHIVNWCFASDDWHAPKSENDLRVGGKIVTTMAAKDESMSFDFAGIYTSVIDYKEIAYTLLDERKISLKFLDNGDSVTIEESFEAEHENSLELQEAGWQAILNNFKKYVEQQ